MNAPVTQDLSSSFFNCHRRKGTAMIRACHFLAMTYLIAAFLFFAVTFLLPTGAEAAIQPLNHRVIDAEYSKVLDRIITVSATPANQLHIIDPISGEDRALGLPYVPTCVSVGPDGIHAAVGHNGHVSYIDLNGLALIRTYEVTVDAFDVVLAGNGYVYVFPREDQWDHFRCIDLATGQETLQTGNFIYERTLAKLHPDGTKIYGVTSSHLERYDITAGTAAYAYYAPYWGSYDACGDAWMSEDGMRVFTACGRVFRSSDAVSEDMTYNGSLFETGGVAHLHHSSAMNKVAFIRNTHYPVEVKDTDVWVFQYDPLEYYTTVPLPPFPVGGVGYESHGKFVFFNSMGSALFAIVQADPESGTLLDYALATLDIGQGGKVYYTINASAGIGGTITPSGAVPVLFGGSANFTITPDADYAISEVRVNPPGWTVGTVSSYTFENVEENHSIEVVFKPTVLGVTASAGQGGTISPSGLVKVSPGSSLTFTITPDAGYAITDVLVDGSSVGAITSYVFRNIQAGHTIAVAFGRVITVAPYYPLVPGTQWTYQSGTGTVETISVLQKLYSINGVEAAQFQYSLSGAKEYYANDESGIRLHGSYSPRAYRNRPGTYTMYPPITIAPAQAVEGRTTHSSGNVYLAVPGVGHGQASYSADYTVNGFETITVTAGAFEALVITYSLTVSSSVETGTIYLVKDIGQIRQTVTYSGKTSVHELVSTNVAVRDLAVTNITRPAVLAFTKSAGTKTSPVKVTIQNRGPFPETITGQTMLSNVVTLVVQSLGSCPNPVPVLTSPSEFPFTIQPKGSLTLSYNVTFDCINDPARSTPKAPNHNDYRFIATVNRAATDGDADSHPSDDVCPRSVTPPYELDPNPDGTIKDKGCGARKSDGTFGGELFIDIVGTR